MRRRSLAERGINKGCPVSLKASLPADFLGDTLGGLENGMKIILLKQLGPAELQNVGMDSTAL